MEAAEEGGDNKKPSKTEPANDQESKERAQREEQLRILSVDKVTVEKIVLESSTGSREVLLTKNESSKKVSIKSELENPVLRRSKDKRSESTSVDKCRSSLPEDIIAFKAFDSTDACQPREGTKKSRNAERIKPIRLTKSPSIGSLTIAGVPLGATTAEKADTGRGKAEEKARESLTGVVNDTADEDKENVRNEGVIIADNPSGEAEEEGGGDEIEKINARNLLEKSQTNIEVLQRNLNTKIDANTAQRYKKKLLESRENRHLKLAVVVDSNANEKFAGKIAFDEEFLQKHNLDKRLKIEEYGLPETDLDRGSGGERGEGLSKRREGKPSYSEKVLEVEKRWSGEFLKNQLDRRSSESSKSSYVGEYGSVSSRESIGEEYDRAASSTLFDGGKAGKFEVGRPINLAGNCASVKTLAASTLSTLDSDSCLEERIKSLEEDIAAQEREELENGKAERSPGRREIEPSDLWKGSALPFADDFWNRKDETSESRIAGYRAKIEERKINGTNPAPLAGGGDRSRVDGYATLIRKFTMEAGSSRSKKEEKQKKRLGLRRLLPGFFSPKDSRKDYKKKESKDRKRPDDRHFARYQQNGNYTRSPDTMNLNEDIKRNVKLDNSLNGSIIEERLDEIKRELFPDQGPITSTPDHLARDHEDHEGLLRDRAGQPRSYTTDSSLSSIAPDERWNERNAQLGISPDIRKFEQRQKREEFGQRYGQRYGQLERKHSLQEPNHSTPRPPYFFQRNHGPSGRISAPPTERYLVRPRAIHPIDRPLPAIPRSRTDLLSSYENYLEERDEGRVEEQQRVGKGAYDKSEYLNEEQVLYENDSPAGLILKSVSAQVKITRQPIVNQNHRAPLVGRSPKYLSSGSSQKSGDYGGDSSCTPNSSQKSEFSPTSSKSGEYYLHSPRNSGSPNERGEYDEGGCRRGEGIYENEKSPSRSSTRCMDERIYDETPSVACEDACVPPDSSQILVDRSSSVEGQRSADKRGGASPRRSRSRGGERPVSPRGGGNAERREDGEKQCGETNRGEQGVVCGPSSPTQGKPISPLGSRQRLPSARRAQPNEQILIASPKRDAIPYETRIPRPSNESRRGCPIESPVHMTNAPRKLVVANSIDPRSQDSSGIRSDVSATKGSPPGQSQVALEIPRPEPIYAHRGQRNPETGCRSSPEKRTNENNAQRTDGEERVAWVQAHASSSSPQMSPQRTSEAGIGSQKVDRSVEDHRQNSVPASHALEAQRNPSLEEQRAPHQQQQDARQVGQRSSEDAAYNQRTCEPMCGQRIGAMASGPLSPSKQETRQHLEAFYWQQKALEAHRKSLASPVSENSKQMGRKIDLPEVREAVYWQQLKKLDEEQQRRIYEQNLMEESSYCKGGPKNSARVSAPRQGSVRGPVATASATGLPLPVAHGNPSSWSGNLRHSKGNPTGKPPLMQSQKGQNQPVLIVRPQQAIRDRRDMVPAKPLDSGRQEAVQRSKSASPHFHRGEAQPVPRKLEVSSIYEEEPTNDVDGKTAHPPPPIFKRGSLIGGESVEYGSGSSAKRVSFSNQSGVGGQDLASGSWPTKHGTAPEPPTRRHRSEDSVSDTDSVFSYPERRDPSTHCADVTEYDADRPLPPLPKDAISINAMRLAPGRSVVYGDTRCNIEIDPRRAISPQRVLRQKGECPYFFYFLFFFFYSESTIRFVARLWFLNPVYPNFNSCNS